MNAIVKGHLGSNRIAFPLLHIINICLVVFCVLHIFLWLKENLEMDIRRHFYWCFLHYSGLLPHEVDISLASSSIYLDNNLNHGSMLCWGHLRSLGGSNLLHFSEETMELSNVILVLIPCMTPDCRAHAHIGSYDFGIVNPQT